MKFVIYVTIEYIKKIRSKKLQQITKTNESFFRTHKKGRERSSAFQSSNLSVNIEVQDETSTKIAFSTQHDEKSTKKASSTQHDEKSTKIALSTQQSEKSTKINFCTHHDEKSRKQQDILPNKPIHIKSFETKPEKQNTSELFLFKIDLKTAENAKKHATEHLNRCSKLKANNESIYEVNIEMFNILNPSDCTIDVIGKDRYPELIAFLNLDESPCILLHENNIHEANIQDINDVYLKSLVDGKDTVLLKEIYGTSLLSEKSGIPYRLIVVTAEVFEDAMRQFQIEQYEVTHTNYFPRNIRMFVCIPVYKGGFINRRDNKDRRITL